jgi:hypothetical protein
MKTFILKLVFFAVFVVAVYGAMNYFVVVQSANQQTDLALKQFDKGDHVEVMTGLWFWSFDTINIAVSMAVLFVGAIVFWTDIHSCIGWCFGRSNQCCQHKDKS